MGSKLQDLKTVYTEAVRPVLEYASSGNTVAQTNKARLDKVVQNLGLRRILGAMKTTPIAELEKTVNSQPVGNQKTGENPHPRIKDQLNSTTSSKDSPKTV